MSKYRPGALGVAARAPAFALSVLALVLAGCSGSAPAAQPTAAPAKPAATTAPPAQAAAAATPASGAAPAAANAAGGGISCAEFGSQGSGGATIRIGADGSLTGPTANFGTGMKRGIEIC